MVVKRCANIQLLVYFLLFNSPCAFNKLTKFSICKNKEKQYVLCCFHISSAYYVYKIAIYEQKLNIVMYFNFHVANYN